MTVLKQVTIVADCVELISSKIERKLVTTVNYATTTTPTKTKSYEKGGTKELHILAHLSQNGIRKHTWIRIRIEFRISNCNIDRG